jgi:hypothetical protein
MAAMLFKLVLLRDATKKTSPEQIDEMEVLEYGH